ncbi:hypothetical protein ATCC90586_007568 [Pythium insidiosum]|nr:hypothetical protein ATCC90586_007568 [Pythium insidiosum]
MHSLKSLEDVVMAEHVQLVIVDSIAALHVKTQNLSFGQWEQHLLGITRQLKYIGDTHRVFLLATNRASTIDSENSVVQPFDITERGVEPIEEDSYGIADTFEDDFEIHDEVLRELDLSGLPTVSPSLTLRSTQQSSQEEDEEDTLATSVERAEPVMARLAESDDIVCDSASESED